MPDSRKIVVSGNEYARVLGNRGANNGPIRVIADSDFVCDAFHRGVNHLDNRQDKAKKRSKDGILCGNFRLYTHRRSSMFWSVMNP